MRPRFPAAVPFLLASACALAAGCSRSGPDLQVRVGHESDVLSLDPAAVAESATHSVLSSVYEPLVASDRQMALGPGLAVSWSSLDDRTWLLELREGVRFHDGAPLDAAEAARALERVRRSPAAGLRAHLASIERIEVADGRRLRLRTSRRDPLLASRLTYVLLARESPSAPGGLVGTGPYRIVRWAKGEVLETEAFAQHWRGRPAFPSALFVPTGGDERALEALQSGRVDVLRRLPEHLVERARGLSGVRVLARPGLGTTYLWFNPAAPGAAAFRDARVRRAFSLAVDRAQLVQRSGGYATPALQLVQPGVFGHVASLPPLAHDPAAARRLLAEAGYPGGLEVEMAHRSDVAATTSAAAALADMLGSVGIRVRRVPGAWDTQFRDWDSGRLGLVLMVWRFENGDAHSFLVDCVASRDAARHHGSFNPGFSSPVLDPLIAAHGELFGDAARLRSYERLMAAAMEEMPLVPLLVRDDLYAVSSRIRWEPRLDGRVLAAEMAPAGR